MALGKSSFRSWSRRFELQEPPKFGSLRHPIQPCPLSDSIGPLAGHPRANEPATEKRFWSRATIKCHAVNVYRQDAYSQDADIALLTGYSCDQVSPSIPQALSLLSNASKRTYDA